MSKQPPADMPADETFDPTAEEAHRVANELNQAPAGPEPAEAPPDPNVREVEVKGPHEDKRLAIAANYRRRPEAQDDASTDAIDPNDPALTYGSHPEAGDDMDDQEREALQRARVAAGEGEEPAAEAPQYEVNVNGERRLVTVAQLISNFQKNSAADQRLHQAAELLKAAGQLAQTRNASAADTQAEPPPAPGKPSTSPLSDITDEELAKVLEQVQYGDPADGAAALRQYGEMIAARVQPAPTPAPVDARSQVRFALEDERSERALKTFVEQNADIAADPGLQRVTADFAHAEMLQDLLTVLPEEEIRATIRNPRDLVLAHKAARVEGWDGIRSPEEILAASLTTAKKWAQRVAGGNAAPAQPANGNGQTDRLERKRTSVQLQPAMRGQPPRAPTQISGDLTAHRSAAVAKMRQARGQVTG